MVDRGIVISSSGVRLVEEIGNLTAIVRNTRPERYQWRHVYGTSGGALISAFLCQYPIGQEIQAVDDLNKLVKEYLGENGAREYFLGMAKGLLWDKSLYDSSFLGEIVGTYIKPEKIRDSGRHLYILTVDYAGTRPVVYTEKNWEIIKDVVIASCSIPLVYPPKEVPDDSSPTGVIYCADGGVTDFVPLERALDNPEIGFLDVIVSVGDPQLRSLDFAKKGVYPTLKQIANVMVEAFYRTSADQVDEMIRQANLDVLMKKQIKSNPRLLDDLPTKEAERIRKGMNISKRDSYIECTVFKPGCSIAVGAVGIEESISDKLWTIGFRSGIATLENTGEIVHNLVL